jgi:MoaA/NifB/PqqE/SkfB family radical SAM enzyme
MDSHRLYQLIDELKELQVFDIILAGGEPFLHPDIFCIIEYALNRGIQLSVLSNGVLLNEEARMRLAKIVAGKRFILQISLDSVDPLVNDRTRGKGAIVIENVLALSRLSVQMQIACVLTSANIEKAHLIIDRLYPGVKRFHFLNIQRTERALRNPDLLLSEKQVDEFWTRLEKHAGKFPSDLLLPSLRVMLRTKGKESIGSRWLDKQATFDCKACSAGITHINIDSDFYVLGCDIAKDFTVMGNVKNTSFTTVWNSREAYMVRNAPFPACYRIKNSAGESLQDSLKDEYRWARQTSTDT